MDYRVPVGTTVDFTLAAGCDGNTFVRGGSPVIPGALTQGPGQISVGIDSADDWAEILFAASSDVFVSACGVDTGYVYPGSAYTLVDLCPDESIPPPVLQQVPAAGSDSCAALPAALNWGGSASGGWGQSWATWAIGGQGGSVCTRTLVYSPSLGHWVVAADAS